MGLLYVALFAIFCPVCLSVELKDVLMAFGDKYCIAGSLSTINPDNIDLTDEIIPKDLLPPPESWGKSALASLNELTQYNAVTHSYELIKEEGPPHDKLFTLTLHLGDETYTTTQQSLKKAQQECAFEALKNTQYLHPPVTLKTDSPTPTSLLNNLASKLGLKVTYTTLTQADVLSKKVTSVPIAYNKINETFNKTLYKEQRVKGPFTVMVEVNGGEYQGTSHTIKSAKHKAALKALEVLRGDQKAFECLDQDDNCKDRKRANKSPISEVYEESTRRGLAVKFEVVEESGPSHRKTFITLCKVGELEAVGKGKSKKESKKRASEEMLPKLKDLPVPSNPVKADNPGNDNKKNKKSKNKIIKTTFDKIDRILGNVVDFGKSIFTGKSDDGDTKPKTSPFDDLKRLSRILNLNVDFTEYTQTGKTFSVLDLGLKFICLGEGVNRKNSRDLASKHGIHTLNKLGYLDGILDKESELSDELQLEEGYQKFYLELIREDQKDEL